jgi:hypothetical protein
MVKPDAVTRWLLDECDPAVAALARRDLLDDDPKPPTNSPLIETLLTDMPPTRPYDKWAGTHWRLVSLVELGVGPDEERAQAGAEHVLRWLSGPAYQDIATMNGLPLRHASIEGNGLATTSRLGHADDPRAKEIAERLIACQWRDGGWNCDKQASGRRSSFHETLATMWGLHEYARACSDRTAGRNARAAADRAAELFLDHRLYRSKRTGEPIKKEFLALHYPPYWHYDILQALLVLSRMGKASDPRTADAIDVVK